ncbi:MAG TPA: acetylxylan esterase [Acidobacteriaceae bacterium]|jgi:cephalosporin-C deacetylase-like acetyl esterase
MTTIYTASLLLFLGLASALTAQQPAHTEAPPPLTKFLPDAPENTGRAQFNRALNQLGAEETAARREVVARITTRAQAEARQKEVRARIFKLIGGLPERTPLQPQVLGENTVAGIRVQKIVFQSQPGFYVTALMYLPQSANGKLPAIVIAPGHGVTGKASDFSFALAFASNGFAVLSYDPIGQGERLQYLDPATGQSKLARPTGEHAEAALQPTLVGDALARYFIWDAMRAVDYLQTRPEVDSTRIGAFGCSGGGTMTAMLSAMDPRIQVTGTACYITSFDKLLPSIGPQDGEQSIPNFIASGLDFPDWVELAAPHPYAIISTTEDMFPFAGAQATEAEARRFYGLFGADADLAFITGPGGHGNLRPIQPKILGFFIEHLHSGADAEHPVVPPMIKINPGILQVTRTGQVATEFANAETVHTLNLKRFTALIRGRKPQPVTAALVRKTIHATAIPGKETPAVTVSETTEVAGHPKLQLLKLVLHSPDGLDLPAELIEMHNAKRVPATLSLDESVSQLFSSAEPFVRLAESGRAVLRFAPRPSPPGHEETKSPLLGTYYLPQLRAELVGRTLLGLRVDDVIRATNMLCARPEITCDDLHAEGDSHLSLVLLHAAVLDTRFKQVKPGWPFGGYRAMVQEPVPVEAPEDIVPGVALLYDLPDLDRLIGRRMFVIHIR